MNSEHAPSAARVDGIVTQPSAVTVRTELIAAGFQQGQSGTTEVRCDDCDKSCNGKRGWWIKVSYEYDEWKCLCRACAYADVHQYDDFDSEAFERAMAAV